MATKKRKGGLAKSRKSCAGLVKNGKKKGKLKKGYKWKKGASCPIRAKGKK